MGKTTEELCAELADAARALLEAHAAYNALFARPASPAEKSGAINRITQAREGLRSLLEKAPTLRNLPNANGR